MTEHPSEGLHNQPRPDFLKLDPAAAAQVCALSMTTARAAQSWAAKHGVVTPDIASPIAMSAAFAAPWRHPDELAVANRIGHWTMWLDELIEIADSDIAVADLAERCGAVATGDDPGRHDSTTLALADIHGMLVTAPLWPALSALWQDALARLINAHGQQRVFARDLAAGRPPAASRYLADTCGVELCWMSHLIASEGPDVLDDLSPLLAALKSADQAIRLANDLSTIERDRRDGDVNVLMLGMVPDEAREMATTHIDRALSALAPLVAKQVRAAIEIARRTSYVTTFYLMIDYRNAAVNSHITPDASGAPGVQNPK
jgi:hypothetical protein